MSYRNQHRGWNSYCMASAEYLSQKGAMTLFATQFGTNRWRIPVTMRSTPICGHRAQRHRYIFAQIKPGPADSLWLTCRTISRRHMP